jgi:hypothetical protein
MIPLHKVPAGLLSLLRARTLGTNPTELSGAVVAIINSTPHYGSDLQVVDSFSPGAGAINASLVRSQTFPGRMIAMSGRVTLGAAVGTFLRLRVQYSPGPSWAGVTLHTESYSAPLLAAGSTYEIGLALPEPIVFSAGALMTFEVIGDAAGADHVPTVRTLFENYAAL